MKRKKTLDERFPTKAARERADAAVDCLDVHLPMHEFIDTWVAAYRAFGGVEPKR